MIIKHILNRLLAIPERIYNYIILKHYHVDYGKRLEVRGKIFCVSNTREGITIGDDVKINSCRRANPIGGDDRTVLFAKGKGKIRIGNRCGISNSTIFACEEINIGNDVFIGGAVKVYDTDFHWVDYFRRTKEEGGNSKPVRVEDGVFIGAHSIILKGVTIGEKSVIGAGSVVTKSIPPGEVWAGNPAKKIRTIESNGEYDK